jgi:hypothetical protein
MLVVSPVWRRLKDTRGACCSKLLQQQLLATTEAAFPQLMPESGQIRSAVNMAHLRCRWSCCSRLRTTARVRGRLPGRESMGRPTGRSLRRCVLVAAAWQLGLLGTCVSVTIWHWQRWWKRRPAFRHVLMALVSSLDVAQLCSRQSARLRCKGMLARLRPVNIFSSTIYVWPRESAGVSQSASNACHVPHPNDCLRVAWGVLCVGVGAAV